MTERRWKYRGHGKGGPEKWQFLARECKISGLLARLSANRGHDDPDKVKAYIDSGLDDLYDPLLMADMEKGVSLLSKAMDRGENIGVYGDYDADGICGCALLIRFFREKGIEPCYFLANRHEGGYGFNRRALDFFISKKTDLIITVDCGISDFETISRAKELGIKIIVVDHHDTLKKPEEPGKTPVSGAQSSEKTLVSGVEEPGKSPVSGAQTWEKSPPLSEIPLLPPADAIIDPKRCDCAYPFKELCGTGVAWNLLKCLCKLRGWPLNSQLLELVALATVSDVVPLISENRILVKEGLPFLGHTSFPGIWALLSISQAKKPLDEELIAFDLAPRINAAGRMMDPSLALELLITDDGALARKMAYELEKCNLERKSETGRIYDEILDMPFGDDLPIFWSDQWNPGIVGLVCSRFKEKHNRPIFTIAFDEMGIGIGSARSVEWFPLSEILSSCSDLLQRFGGHALAGGFSIKYSKLGAFQERIQGIYQKRKPESIPAPCIELDCELPLSMLGESLINEINRAGPFGQGNPRPLFSASKIDIRGVKFMGVKKDHIRFFTVHKGAKIGAVGFNLADKIRDIQRARQNLSGPDIRMNFVGQSFNIAYEPKYDYYNDKKRLQIFAEDLKLF